MVSNGFMLRTRVARFHESQLVDQLPTLPQRQLELAQVALESRFALLHGCEQGVECVPFSLEGLRVMLEAARRKERG